MGDINYVIFTPIKLLQKYTKSLEVAGLDLEVKIIEKTKKVILQSKDF